jgi:uncharacterized protein YndB with AHSA1/START domain
MMATSTTESTKELTAVHKTITVAAPQQTAFQVFTEGMSSWWPLATHHIGKVDAAAVVIEPRVGGRCFERGVDGSECPWGHVLAWEPSSRFVFSWEISADWQVDGRTMNTEVEVLFIPEIEDRTRVELSHRHLDRYGARREEMRAVFDSPGGWTGLLEMFARAASAARA